MNTYHRKILDNILSTTYESFDQATLENAKYRIIDVLGCVIRLRMLGNLALVNLVRWGGTEEAYFCMVAKHQP